MSKANLLKYNPSILLTMPNKIANHREPFSKSDINKLTNIFTNLDDRKYIYYTLLYTGMRPSEFWKCKISTSDAYTKIQPQIPGKLITEIMLQPIETWKNKLRNDFEELIFTEYPQIRMLKESLYKSGAVYASMSGSGSAVYGIFNEQPILTPAIKKQIVWAGFIDQGCHLPSSIRP